MPLNTFIEVSVIPYVSNTHWKMREINDTMNKINNFPVKAPKAHKIINCRTRRKDDATPLNTFTREEEVWEY